MVPAPGASGKPSCPGTRRGARFAVALVPFLLSTNADGIAAGPGPGAGLENRDK
jgi:hypothetical protein